MANARSLWQAFQALPKAKGGASGTLRGIRVEQRRADYLTASPSGAPALLLQCQPDTKPRAPITLKNLAVEFRLHCKVVEPSGSHVTSDFAKVECIAEDTSAHQAFIAAGEAMIRALPANPTEAQVTHCIDALVDIFSALNKPSKRSITGLWAELFLISIAKSPDKLLKAWHIDADEKYDFSFGKLRLEVKASEMQQRVHEFAIEQLRPSAQAPVLIVSILVQRSAGGAGILDLLDQISRRARDSALVAKAWANVTALLGREFNEAVDIKFDASFARNSLRVIEARNVPSIPVPLPKDVISARLKVSMDGCVRTHGKQWPSVEKVLSRA